MLDERRECTEGGSAEVRSSKIPYLQILQMKQGQTVTPTWAVKENPNEVWIWSETVEIVQMFSSAWCNPNEVWIWSKKVQMFPHIHVSNKTSLKYNSWYRDKKSSINKYMENPNAREALQLKHWHFFFNCCFEFKFPRAWHALYQRRERKVSSWRNLILLLHIPALLVTSLILVAGQEIAAFTLYSCFRDF